MIYFVLNLNIFSNVVVRLLMIALERNTESLFEHSVEQYRNEFVLKILEKKIILKCQMFLQLCLPYQCVALSGSSGKIGITESQNSRGWKGPLWVI